MTDTEVNPLPETKLARRPIRNIDPIDDAYCSNCGQRLTFVCGEPDCCGCSEAERVRS